MKETEIFYFDVDGTILDNNTQIISDNTKDAIRSLKALGHKIAICTGRTRAGIENTEMHKIAKWDLYILANGSLILDEDLNVLKQENCNPDFVKELINAYQGPILLEGDDLYITEKLSEHMEDFLKSGDLEIPNIIKYEKEEIQKVILEDFSLIESGFEHPLFKDYQYNVNTHGLYEIYPKQGGKHTGMEIGNQHFKVSQSVFFGDGTNDISALKFATTGIAMGNATDIVKDAADLVTSDVSNDGIYNILKEHNII